MGVRLGFGVAAGLVAAALTSPGLASAADTYVDKTTGDDANPCTMAQPCEEIQAGVEAASAADTVHVDQGAYVFDVVVGDGKSIVADDFVAGDAGQTAVNSAFTPLTVLASGAGTIEGLSFTTTSTPIVNIGGPANFTGNSVLVPGAGDDGITIGAASSDAVTVEGNQFFGNNTSFQVAIHVFGANPTIENNDIGSALNGFNGGVFLEQGAQARIVGNRFRAFFLAESIVGQPIVVQDSTATITENSVRENGAGTVHAVGFFETADPEVTGGDLHRNEFYGNGSGTGVRLQDTDGAVSLDGDVIAGFGDGGVSTDDAGNDSATEADVEITGATLADNGSADIRLDDADLTMDSTILETAVNATGTVTCTITFSRAEGAAPGGNGCADVQTTATPGFVDPSPAAGDPDLHLLPSSPMIDQGNPADPGLAAVDIDGDPRGLDTATCTPGRRDIGADEFFPDCDAPTSTITKGPRGTVKTRKRKAKVRFRFESEPGATFQCALDAGALKPCDSPHTVKVKAKRRAKRHSFSVVATDASGNVQAPPAKRSFKVVRRR